MLLEGERQTLILANFAFTDVSPENTMRRISRLSLLQALFDAADVSGMNALEMLERETEGYLVAP